MRAAWLHRLRWLSLLSPLLAAEDAPWVIAVHRGAHPKALLIRTCPAARRFCYVYRARCRFSTVCTGSRVQMAARPPRGCLSMPTLVGERRDPLEAQIARAHDEVVREEWAPARYGIA